MTNTDLPKSTGEMMNGILGNVGSLERSETNLARAEVDESTGNVMSSLGAMFLALALGIVGLNMLAASVIVVLIWAGLPPLWAVPVVCGCLLMTALMIFNSAKSKLYQIGVVPTRTASNVQRDTAIIKTHQ